MVWVCLTVRAGVKNARLEGLGGEWRKVHGLMLERELSPRSPGDADAGSRDRDVSPRIDELPRVHKGRVRPAVRRLAREKNVGSYSSPRAELHAYTVAGWFSEEGILPCGPPTLVAFTRSVVHTPWGKKCHGQDPREEGWEEQREHKKTCDEQTSARSWVRAIGGFGPGR
jgi:hypothetical protein